MARDFSKNTSNYCTIGVGVIGSMLNGAGAVSMHAIVQGDSFDTGENDNIILQVLVNGTNSSGAGLCIDGSAGSRVRAFGRSQSSDGYQARSGNTDINNAERVVGGVLDFANSQIRIYLEGAGDGSGAVSFGSSSYVQGSPSVADKIGRAGATVTTAGQFDGRISELAIWLTDIGATGFAQLGQRYSPLSVRPDALVAYWPLHGRSGSIIELINRKNATITGTLAAATHPRMIYPRHRPIVSPPAAEAAASFPHSWGFVFG